MRANRGFRVPSLIAGRALTVRCNRGRAQKEQALAWSPLIATASFPPSGQEIKFLKGIALATRSPEGLIFFRCQILDTRASSPGTGSPICPVNLGPRRGFSRGFIAKRLISSTISMPVASTASAATACSPKARAPTTSHAPVSCSPLQNLKTSLPRPLSIPTSRVVPVVAVA